MVTRILLYGIDLGAGAQGQQEMGFMIKPPPDIFEFAQYRRYLRNCLFQIYPVSLPLEASRVQAQ